MIRNSPSASPEVISADLVLVLKPIEEHYHHWPPIKLSVRLWSHSVDDGIVIDLKNKHESIQKVVIENRAGKLWLIYWLPDCEDGEEVCLTE